MAGRQGCCGEEWKAKGRDELKGEWVEHMEEQQLGVDKGKMFSQHS